MLKYASYFDMEFTALAFCISKQCLQNLFHQRKKHFDEFCDIMIFRQKMHYQMYLEQAVLAWYITDQAVHLNNP